MVKRLGVALLVMVALAAASHTAMAADAPKDTATVEFSLSNPGSSFALALPEGPNTYSLTDDLKVNLDLLLYVVRLPEGYKRGAAASRNVCALSKVDDGEAHRLQSVVMTTCRWSDFWTVGGASTTATMHMSASAAKDVETNVRTATTRIEPTARMQTYATSMGNGKPPLPDLDLASYDPDLHVDVWSVTAPDAGSPLNMAEVYMVWHLKVPLHNLDKLEVKGDLVTLTATLPKMEAASGSGETAAAGSDTSNLSFFSDLNFSREALRSSPGYDVVVGFAAPNTGPQGMAGVVASFERQKDADCAPEDWRHRLGILGGRTVGSSPLWIIAPSYKIGSRSHLFAGPGFADADGNTRNTWVFGMAYSAGDIAAAALDRPSSSSAATKPSKVSVTIAPDAVRAPTRARTDSKAPVVYLRCTEGAMHGTPPLERARLVVRDGQNQDQFATAEEMLFENNGYLRVEGPRQDALLQEGWKMTGACGSTRAKPGATGHAEFTTDASAATGKTLMRLMVAGIEKPITDTNRLELKAGEAYFAELSLPPPAAGGAGGAGGAGPAPVSSALTIPADANGLLVTLLQANKDGKPAVRGPLASATVHNVTVWKRAAIKGLTDGGAYSLRVEWTDATEQPLVGVNLTDKHQFDLVILPLTGADEWHLQLAALGLVSDSLGALDKMDFQVWRQDAASDSSVQLTDADLAKALAQGSYELRCVVNGHEYKKTFEVPAAPKP